MTATDYLAAFAAVFLLGLVFTLVIREHRREVAVRDALLVADMRAADIAADTLARAEVERQEAAMVRRVELTVLRVKGEGS